jgi:aspartyl protease family protein
MLGELASWAAAAAIVVVGIMHYDTLRSGLGDALGLPALQSATEDGSQGSAEAPTPTARSGTEELKAAPDGHYYARAEVNGREIDVMVDTGASMVALTYEDAEEAGLRLRPADFTSQVSTANGVAAVAPVTLDRVSIGRITVRNVRAAVCERGRLERTLLGMSFLSKLDGVGISQGRLVLRE